MRRTTIVLVVSGCLALTGCSADEAAEPTAERSGPATLAPEDMGEDEVDLDVVQDGIDDLRENLGSAEPEAEADAEAALDSAQTALDAATQAREGGTQEDRDAAVGTVESAVEALDGVAGDSPDAFGRAASELAENLRLLAEELRRAPG